MLNAPFNGGTHLPDVTVITPVFGEDGDDILFWVGSRGHHADIGGKTPGSGPPDSTHIDEEGVVIDNFRLVERGTFRAETRARSCPPAHTPAAMSIRTWPIWRRRLPPTRPASARSAR
jgi:N-methylhydantoinase B/oxoprolinase/acetone carboxylase alpha subunit